MKQTQDSASTTLSTSRLRSGLLAVVALSVLLLSTLLLFQRHWSHGAFVTRCDSFIYLRTALSLAHGEGFTMLRYQPSSDMLLRFPSTHYPPMLSLAYAAAYAAGLAPSLVPSVIALLSWPFLLVGIGVLTYRLGGSPFVALLAATLAAFLYAFRFVFLLAMSEVLFLPLLVWLMVVLVDLPARSSGKLPRLLVAVVLLALLILTRYVGVVVLGAVGLWWGWSHLSQRNDYWIGWMVGGGVALASAALPFLLWLLINRTHTAQPLSTHLILQGTWRDAIIGLLLYSSHLVFPAGPVSHLIDDAGLPGLAFYLSLFLFGVGVCWHYRPRRPLLTPHRSPVLIFVLLYVALYTVAEPFFEFQSIDLRDMTSIMCVLLPFVFATMEHAPTRLSYPLLIAYVVINSVLSGPITITDKIPRTADLETFHAPLLQSFQAQNNDNATDETVIITNEPLLFAQCPDITAEDMREPCHHARSHNIVAWLEEGQCHSQYATYIVIVDSGYLAPRANTFREQVEQRCPDLPRHQFPQSTVYTLSPP